MRDRVHVVWVTPPIDRRDSRTAAEYTTIQPIMSRKQDAAEKHRTDPPRPLDPVSGWSLANWARVHFEYTGTGYAIKKQARRRAPNEQSIGRHQTGFAGEVAASTLLRVSANWEIYPDYKGDNGFDFIYDGQRIEVKTTNTMQQPQLKVPKDQINDADQFILTVSQDPRRLVYIVGSVSRPDLKIYGHKFDDELRVGLEWLDPFEPREVSPETVREIQDLQGNLGLYSQ